MLILNWIPGDHGGEVAGVRHHDDADGHRPEEDEDLLVEAAVGQPVHVLRQRVPDDEPDVGLHVDVGDHAAGVEEVVGQAHHQDVERHTGVQLNIHFELLAQNRAQNWAKF